MLYGVETQPKFVPPPPLQVPAIGNAHGFGAAQAVSTSNAGAGHADGIGAAIARAGIIGRADGIGASVGLSPVDSATSAWFTAVGANGGTVSSARILTVDTLIKGLKTDGIWTKLDRLYLLAAENSISARTDLVGGSLAALGSPAPSFLTDRGFTGAGSAGSSINTGFNQAIGSHSAIQNDTHFSLWSNTNPLPTSVTSEYAGADPGGGGTYWLYFTTDSSFYFRTNDNGIATGLASSFASHQGHFISSRNSSSTRRAYYNGTLHNTTTQTSNPVPNTAHLIISNGLAHQVCAYSIGSNLDAGSDAANFYSRLRTYMTAVGVP